VLANRIERAVLSDRAKRALEESERRLSTLISNLPGMVYRCRNERGWPMTFVSDGAAALTGYSADAIESGEVNWAEDVLHEEDREEMWEQVQTAIDAGEPFEVTYHIETANGERRWMWERGRTVETTDGSDVIEGFITDITARKERARTDGGARVHGGRPRLPCRTSSSSSGRTAASSAGTTGSTR